jgi:hypothetical protein
MWKASPSVQVALFSYSPDLMQSCSGLITGTLYAIHTLNLEAWDLGSRKWVRRGPGSIFLEIDPSARFDFLIWKEPFWLNRFRCRRALAEGEAWGRRSINFDYDWGLTNFRERGERTEGHHHQRLKSLIHPGGFLKMAAVMVPKRELQETQMLHQKVFVRSSRGRATKVLSSTTRKSLTTGCKRTLSTNRHPLWLRTLLRMQCNPLIDITSRYLTLTLSQSSDHRIPCPPPIKGTLASLVRRRSLHHSRY